MRREEAHKETLEYERETQQQALRTENTALRERLTETANVIRTVGGDGDGAVGGDQEGGAGGELLQKLLAEVDIDGERGGAGGRVAGDVIGRLDEAEESCSMGHRLFSEGAVTEALQAFSAALDGLDTLSEEVEVRTQEVLEDRVGQLSLYCMVESARCYQTLQDHQQVRRVPRCPPPPFRQLTPSSRPPSYLVGLPGFGQSLVN